MLNRVFVLSLLVFVTFSLQAQENKLVGDTVKVKKEKEHSPMLASTLSAVLPGAGQVYNHKIWKVPIVYAGLGAGAYFFTKNYSNYLVYRQAYVQRQAYTAYPDQYVEDQFYGVMSDIELKSRVADAHRYFELAIVGTLAFYVLNIVDASVDAHLFNFDVSDDLSFNIVPVIDPMSNNNSFYKGVGVNIKF